MIRAPSLSDRPSPDSEHRINLVQGQYHVSSDPDLVLTTTLGSCIAACIRDPLAGAGGMNHFLLPDGGDDSGPEALRYGVHAMELLINQLLRCGARRDRMEAKLFGGARLIDNLADVGAKNAEFAVTYLSREGIRYAGGSLRGHKARRIQFWPVSGRIRQLTIARTSPRLANLESQKGRPPVEDGAVEWFQNNPASSRP